MLKLTKTGIGLLTKQYRSVLKKCLLLNLLVTHISSNVMANVQSSYGEYEHLFDYIYDTYTLASGRNNYIDVSTTYTAGSNYVKGPYFDLENFVGDVIQGRYSYTKSQTNALLNYYYTFRVDEIVELIDFTKELKETFPVILRSAEHDVRISAQSAAKIDTGLKSGDRHVASLLTMTNHGVNVAEDSLTRLPNGKARDDSLGLMEVCHA